MQLIETYTVKVTSHRAKVKTNLYSPCVASQVGNLPGRPMALRHEEANLRVSYCG